MTQTDTHLKIIDTHVHIWNLEKIRYSWLDADTSILKRTYLFDELRPTFNKVGVNAAVLVQAANNLEDTYWMLETAGRFDEFKGVVGWLPLKDPALVQRLLEENFLREKYFKGVRHLIHNEPDPQWLLQAPVVESLQLLAAYGIPYDVVGINDEHLKTVIRVTEKIPALNLVLDHLNQPPILSKQKFGTWGALMKEIAASPNSFAKISGLGTASGKLLDWSPDDVEPYIEFALTQFGSVRCFCGGDWPVSQLAGTYEKLWSIYIDILKRQLNREELAAVLSANAQRFYQLQD